MKKFAKWIAVFAAAAMVVTGLAACGDKPNDGGGNSGGSSSKQESATPEPVRELTAQEILAEAAKAVNDMDSYALTADMDVEMVIDMSAYNMGEMDMNMQMRIDAEATRDPEVAHISMYMDMDSMGEAITQEAETYTWKEDSSYVSYIRTVEDGEASDWYQTENTDSVDTEGMLAGDMYTAGAEGKYKAEIDKSVTTYKGQNVYTINATVSGDMVKELMGGAGEAMNLSDEAIKDLSYDLTMYFDRASLLPVAVEFDMKDLMMSAMGASMGEDYIDMLKFNNCGMVIEYTGFNLIDEIALPDFNAPVVPDDGGEDDYEDPGAWKDTQGRYVIHAYDDFYAACPVPEGFDLEYSSEFEVSGTYEVDGYLHDIFIDYYFLADTTIDQYDEYCDAAFIAQEPDEYVNVEKSENSTVKVGDYEMVFSRVAYDDVVIDDDGNELEPNHYVEYEGWIEKNGVTFVVMFEECRLYDTAETVLPNDAAFLSFINGLTIYDGDPAK